MVDPVKITMILNLEALRSVKQICTTLGHTGYYRKFIKSYAQSLRCVLHTLVSTVSSILLNASTVPLACG